MWIKAQLTAKLQVQVWRHMFYLEVKFAFRPKKEEEVKFAYLDQKKNRLKTSLIIIIIISNSTISTG